MIRILIVDDHVSSREALAFLLDHQSDMNVVAQASSLAAAKRVSEEFDVAIVDYLLPDGHGTSFIQKLRSGKNKIHSFLLTAKEDRLTFAKALEAGADGVLHKSANIEQIVKSVRQLACGEPIHSSQEIMDVLHFAGHYREKHQQMQQLIALLTPRERELLQSLADGLSDREVASQLSISVRTVQTHVANILGKLGVDTRLQALVNAARYGVVTIDDY